MLGIESNQIVINDATIVELITNGLHGDLSMILCSAIPISSNENEFIYFLKMVSKGFNYYTQITTSNFNFFAKSLGCNTELLIDMTLRNKGKIKC